MTRIQPIVLSLGGSIFITGENDAEFLQQLLLLIKKVSKSGPLAIVVGGGRTARQYITVGRELGLVEVELDEIGIEVTRLHAKMLAHLLAPDAPLKPPESIPEAAGEIGRWPIVVMGGTEPGHTTDGVAALLAERIRARLLVNATRVGGLYDKDPRKHDDARLIPSMDFDKFVSWVSSQTQGKAGQEFVFDRLGAESLARSRIPLAVLNGRNLKNLQAALEGKKFDGSLISDAV
jgi:uridylate kinase